MPIKFRPGRKRSVITSGDGFRQGLRVGRKGRCALCSHVPSSGRGREGRASLHSSAATANLWSCLPVCFFLPHFSPRRLCILQQRISCSPIPSSNATSNKSRRFLSRWCSTLRVSFLSGEVREWRGGVGVEWCVVVLLRRSSALVVCSAGCAALGGRRGVAWAVYSVARCELGFVGRRRSVCLRWVGAGKGGGEEGCERGNGGGRIRGSTKDEW